MVMPRPGWHPAMLACSRSSTDLRLCHWSAVRKAKAEAVFPRPTAGALRPIVHGQTLRYQAKRRSGRGFTHEELKVRQHRHAGRGPPT